MKDLYHCKSCGFISTQLKAYTHFKGILVCVECKEYYGIDENITRWIDEKVRKIENKTT